MKKIILFALFFIASITCFCQYTLVFSIKTDSTPFPRILPSNSLVFVIDSINETYDGVSLFKTLSIIQKDSSLRSIAHIKTNSHYSKLTDSLHLYQEFGIDTIKSSGNTVVNNGLVIKDYLMPLHKGTSGKVLTMSAGDSAIWATLNGFDSTHCWSKLYTDSLSSCSPLVIYSNDTSYYTALGHKFNSNVDADSYINTDSSYYIKGVEFIKANHNLGNQFIGVGSGANNIVDSINNPPLGYLGSLNTANGYYSLYNNIKGYHNVANGAYSLYSNTTGIYNIANGYQSLYSNTEGSNNIANGTESLYSNTEGSVNIAIGYQSLYSNTIGSFNIANGTESLYSNTTGENNIANGFQSLYRNTTGNGNIAKGTESLYSNTTGENNIAIGYQSLYSNTIGSFNIANGTESLYSNTTGNYNIAIGNNSGYYADAAANGLLWIGEGDYNNAIIYGNMLTDSLRLNANVNVGTNLMVNQSATIGTDLTVHGEITNGGLINKDTVIILIDDATFIFPKTSVGWAEIQCDSSLIEKTWGVVSWNGDGSTSLRSNGAKFVNTDIDGNYACFYDGGVYAILKNTSGYTLTYSIKLHYHL